MVDSHCIYSIVVLKIEFGLTWNRESLVLLILLIYYLKSGAMEASPFKVHCLVLFFVLAHGIH